MPHLTPDQRSFFADNGYLILEKILTSDEVRQLQGEAIMSKSYF